MPLFLKKYLAEKLSTQKMGGSLARLSSTLAKSTIDLNPHQIHAALYAFNSPLSRGAILADEVGLGKTIEAGIILSQLWSEGKKRILIITPASLRKQWQDELLVKFGLESEVWDGPSYLNRVNTGEKIPLTYDGIFIISYHFAYGHIELIKKQDWNVVVIDEAHRFRRVYRGRDASKMAYDIREAIKNKPKVLLTATPLQNNLEELYGIVSFIDDKLLGTPYSFKSKFAQPIKDQTNLAAQKLDELRKMIRGEENDDPFVISGVITRTLRKQVLEYVPFRDRSSFTFDFTPTNEEVELYEKVSAYLQRPNIAAVVSTQRNLMILVYRKLLASSSFAIAGTLKKLYENLERELHLREKEKRSESDEYPPNTETPEDEGLEDEFEEAELEVVEHKAKKEKQRVDKSINDEFIQNEVAELKAYYSLAKHIQENSKGFALINALKGLFTEAKIKGWPQKAVVFTESTRTQEYLAGLLKKAGISFVLFNGSNSDTEAREAYDTWRREFPEAASQGTFSTNVRQALIHKFREGAQVFLTTEAGAEGLNLQFCNIVINYDLPWNPQRIEQRIGRCHRYGQIYQVVVANFLNTKNYADRRVLQLLGEKLNLFDGLFGSSDEVLGALESGIDFEKRIFEIYQKCKTPEQYDKAFDELQESLKGVISENILKYRELLLETTDHSVAELFKRTDIETKYTVSTFDKELLRLCQLVYGNKMSQAGVEGVWSVEGCQIPIAFRELQKEEAGKIARAHKDNPTVKEALEAGLKITTNPIHSLVISLSEYEGKICQLPNSMGKEGFIFLWKLKIRGVEDEDIVVPMAFMNRGGKYTPLEVSVAEELLQAPAYANKTTFGSSPIKENDLLGTWNNWKKPIVEKYQKRNERLFDRETDRINRYYDDYALRVEERVKKLLEERTEISRKRDNSADLEERRNLQKKLQNITIALDKLEIEKLKQKQESAQKREQELKDLWQRLDSKSSEELIAVTHFVIK